MTSPACTLIYFGFMTDSTRYGTSDNNNNLPPVSPQFQIREGCQTTTAATLTDQIIQDSLPLLLPSKVPPYHLYPSTHVTMHCLPELSDI